jgi:hypothetical protein
VLQKCVAGWRRGAESNRHLEAVETSHLVTSGVVTTRGAAPKKVWLISSKSLTCRLQSFTFSSGEPPQLSSDEGFALLSARGCTLNSDQTAAVAV